MPRLFEDLPGNRVRILTQESQKAYRHRTPGADATEPDDQWSPEWICGLATARKGCALDAAV